MRGDLQELCHGQPAASFTTQHLRPWLETASSGTQHPYPQPNGSNLRHPIPVHPAGQQPHLAEIRRWRRQSVQMGREICFVRADAIHRETFPAESGTLPHRPWTPMSREWEAPQAKRGGGMERSGSLCGRVAAPRETLHGRQCGSIGSQPGKWKMGSVNGCKKRMAPTSDAILFVLS